MFKKLLKSRHENGANEPSRLRQYVPGMKNTDTTHDLQRPTSNFPVDYDREAPAGRETSSFSVNPVEYRQSPVGPVNDYSSPSYSVNPVEYAHSPMPPPNAGAGPAPTPYSVNPVEYNRSPMGAGVPGAPVASTQSPFPVSYPASAPPPPAVKQAAQPRTVANPHRLSQPNPAPTRYTYTLDHPPPPSPDVNKRASYSPGTRYPYYAPGTEGAYGQQRAAELPASPVPQRYELQNASVQRQPQYQTPLPPYSPPRQTPRQTTQSPNPQWPGSAGSSTTTLVPSPQTAIPSPTFAGARADTKSSPTQAENDGIKKYLVDVYCPLKADAKGNRREQIPLDVREFRLAKVALIPIVAGKRTFVSLDVVFGEVDRPYSDLVEKHFSCSSKTRLIKVDEGTINGGEVYTVGPLNIAYRDGDQSTVYVKFGSQDDKSRFKSDFWEMWKYVEQSD